ncbi:MAG: 50S ribosomal protein L25, partial [Betaproteobacteria bacterium]|nr:50S ribosomal protein L25 [Betaproteobacteria bacterium]
GVKLEGGVISHIMTEADISCLPKDLPQFIEVNLEDLGLGESVHLSELKLPEGVELTALTEENDPAITTIAKPKVQKADDPAEASEEIEDDASSDASSSSEASGESSNEEPKEE